MTENITLKEAALAYHRYPRPGKISIMPTKPLANQRDLALAYSPGVGAACEAIVENPLEVYNLTNRGNTVAVITNGTAVLGFGAIGALAAKPVMEGKAVLFKKFADIDGIDIEINETDPDKLVDIIASLEPSFGAINLEDIKAPECFEVERKLRERMSIPVLHDDQHGTAIIVAAAITNGLRLVKKDLNKVKIAASGAGAAALACLDLLVAMGVPQKNIFVSDVAGVIYDGRNEHMDPFKSRYAQKTTARTLADIIKGADIFLGLSAPRVLNAEHVKSMAKKPIILALANPVPEMMPDEIREQRPDAIIATGRSDFPNQVNNALCYPYLFRGALDVGATVINEAMKLACVQAIADLAMAEAPDVVTRAYGDARFVFGADYIIPKPFDPRLITKLAPAVAKAAMDSGVATRPIANFKAYEEQLEQFVFRSGLAMKPMFERARENPQRIVYAEGEEERVLHAVQVIVDDGYGKPILIGDPAVIARKINQFGLRLRADVDYTVVNPMQNRDFNQHVNLYHNLMQRKGVSPVYAEGVVRSRSTVLAALLVRSGQADAMLCGSIGLFHRHLNHVNDIIGAVDASIPLAAMNALILNKGTYFLCDTYVNPNPTAEQLKHITLLAAEQVRRFGITPKVALLSHSNFGSHRTPSSLKMQEALQLIREAAPELEVEGEMHADSALSEDIRARIFPQSQLKGTANMFVMPSLDAANIAFTMVKMLGEGLAIGPILLGTRYSAHIMTPSITVRGIVNMTALAVTDAQHKSIAANSHGKIVNI